MPPRIRAEAIARYPVLVTARWCPFTATAESFWIEAGQFAGVEVNVVDAESEEGAGVIMAAGIAGVPCLLAAPGHHFYGIQYSLEEAQSILREAAGRAGDSG